MGRTKKEQQQESLKQNPVNETPEDGDSAEYEEMPDQSEQIMQTGSVTVTKAKHVIHCLTIVGQIAFLEKEFLKVPRNCYDLGKHRWGKRLKVGYVSADLRNHATLHLLCGVFCAHRW